MAINSVTLVGRAGRDPEVRYFESGTVVANLTMAVNRRNRDDEPDWFNLEIWGRQAQVAADCVARAQHPAQRKREVASSVSIQPARCLHRCRGPAAATAAPRSMG